MRNLLATHYWQQFCSFSPLAFLKAKSAVCNLSVFPFNGKLEVKVYPPLTSHWSKRVSIMLFNSAEEGVVTFQCSLCMSWSVQK